MLLLKIISTILKQLPTIINDLNKLGSSLKILDTMNVGTVGLNVGNIQAYQSAIKGLSAEQAVFALATKGANAAQIEEIMTTETATLVKGTYTQADVQAAMAKHGLATASAILTVEQQKEITNSGLLSAEKMAEMASVLGLTTAENGSLVSKKALNAEMVKQQLESIGIVGATQAQIMSILGLATAETGAVAGTNLLTASFAKLWTVISAHPIGAIITAIGTLAVGVVSAVNASNKAKEEARQVAIELTNTYTQEKDSLDSQIEKYKELKEHLDNGNLSTDEARSIKEQLLGIQESLIESYGDEASNIDLVNGKYREQLGLLGELSKEKATEYVTENRDVFADAKEALEKERTFNLGTVTSWNTYSPQTEDQKKLIDYIKSYSDLLDLTEQGTKGYGVSTRWATLSVKADTESADELMHQFAEDLEKYGEENDIDVSGILESISGQLKKTWTDELAEYKTVYDEFMKAEIVRNDTLRPLYQESIQAVENYNKALSTGEGVEEAKTKLDSLQQSVQNATGELEGSQSVFDGIYEGINKDAEAAYNLGKAFENDKTVQSYAEQLRGLTDIDLKAINFDNDKTEKGEEAFKGLIETLGLTEEQVQSLINKLVELGYVQGEVKGSASGDNPTLLSVTETVDQIDKQLKPALDSLGEAYKTIFEQPFNLENVDTVGIAKDLKDEFDELSEAGITIDNTAYEDFVKVLSDTSSTADDVKTAFNELATAITDVSISGIEDFDVLKKSLSDLGVVNDVEVAFVSLARNKEALLAAGLDLSTATQQEISDFASQYVSAENLSQAIQYLTYQKMLNAMVDMDTTEEVSNLLVLAKNAGITGEAISHLTELEILYQEISSGTLNADMMAEYQARANELVSLIKSSATEFKPKVEFTPTIDTKDLDKSAEDAAKAAKETLESTLELYKTELDAGIIDLDTYLKKCNDLLNDARDKAIITGKEYWDYQKEVAENQLEVKLCLAS